MFHPAILKGLVLFNYKNIISGPWNQNYSYPPLNEVKHFAQCKICGFLLFMLTNNLKNSNFKFMRSLLFVYFWNLKETVTLVTHICNVNQSLKDKNEKQKK